VVETKGTLSQIEDSLPAPTPAGYSLKDLQVALSRFGVQVHGVQIGTRPADIDRPLLLHLRRGNHGHFVTVRPVGHSGKLVQLLDALRSPIVLDKADLVRSPEWSGLALVQSERLVFSTVAWIAFLGCLVAGLVGVSARLLRARLKFLGKAVIP
jgi:hypothetical protein